MKCKNHPDRDSMAGCVGCGELICTECDVLVGGRHFCRKCLASASDVCPPGSKPSGGAGPRKRLVRSSRDRVFTGLCGGIGEHLDMDPVLVRVLMVVAILCTGIIFGLIVYFVVALIVPKDTDVGAVR
jgi:phage shock protein C